MTPLIRELLASKHSRVEAIEPGATVGTAVAQMNARHVGSLLVIEQRRLVGILTERDLLVRVLAAKLDPAGITVGSVMTRNPIVITADDTIFDAMTVVTRTRCRHLPVVDRGEICGIVSVGDLTAWQVRDQQQTIDDLYLYITR